MADYIEKDASDRTMQHVLGAIGVLALVALFVAFLQKPAAAPPKDRANVSMSSPACPPTTWKSDRPAPAPKPGPRQGGCP